MCCQGAAVDLGPGAGGAYALGDVEDDAGEAVGVDEDLLVIGDLTDLAVGVLASGICHMCRQGCSRT